MTFAKAWPFQQFMVDQIEAALPGVDVFAHVPADAPDRYVRIDGWTTTPGQTYRNKETARHGVTVHVIDAPERGTRSLSWVKQTLGTVVTALTNVKLDTESDGLRPETGDARLEPRQDKVEDAHAFVRFTARLR